MVINYRNLLICFFTLFSLVLLDGTSSASPVHKHDYHNGQKVDWSVFIGPLGVYKPDYEGADDYEMTVFPLVDVTWRDTFFLNLQKGLGAYLWNCKDVKLGLSVGYAFGRNEGDSSDLRGLGDIDDGATANGLMEWRIGDAALETIIEKQITGEDTGYQIHISLGYDWQIADLNLTSSIVATYASSEYMEKYFSISPSQSTRSDLSVYEADSGFKSIGLHFMALYPLDQHWGIQAMAVFNRLVGDAADSPITKDAQQNVYGLGLYYNF